MIKKDFYNLDEIISLPVKSYNKLVSDIKNEILENFKKTVRGYSYDYIKENYDNITYIKDEIVKISCSEGEEEFDLTYGNLLTILTVFKIINFVINDDPENYDYLKEYYIDFLFDASNTSEINQYYDIIYNELIDYDGIKNIIFENLSELTALSSKFVNGTISLYSICKMYSNVEEFRNALNYKVDKYSEDIPGMIKAIKKNINVIEDLMVSIDSEYRTMILSGSGFNMKQASQIFNVVGPKPDIFGNIHPIAITSNYLNGLKSVAEYFINADGARKALITNFSAVKESGYLTRILSMLCVDTKLSKVKRCNTKISNLPNITIRDKKVLKMYQNRYFWNEEINDYEMLGYNEEYIGKTFKFASPSTCSCKDGVCQTCYGNLSKTNKENIGLIAVLLLTEILTQRLLSTKHLLEANSREIEWQEDILRMFDINNNKMYMIDSEIKLKDILITKLNERTGEIYQITIGKLLIDLPVPIFINGEVYKYEQIDVDTEEYCISYEGEDDISKINKYLFTFSLKNKELSEPLHAIKDLINTDEITERNIEENINHFIELIEKANIYLSSEHMEIIIRELVFTKDRRTFELDDIPSYEMYRASKKVIKGNVTKAILFERLKEQLLNYETYIRENEDSMLDFLLYKEKIRGKLEIFL